MAWPRLLVYPGGLFAIVAAWLVTRWLHWCARIPWRTATFGTYQTLGSLLPPLVAISLLPLAPARPFPYGLDLFVALGLLEWPRMQQWLQQQPTRSVLLQRYWPLLLAALGWAEAVGGVGLSRLLAWPEAPLNQALLLVSTALWLSAVAPFGSHPGSRWNGAKAHWDAMSGYRLSAIGYWHWDSPALRLRTLGMLLIGSLPILAALAAHFAATLDPWAGWVLPCMAMLSATLLLGGLVRLPPQGLYLLQRGLALGLVGVYGVREMMRYM
ncbi:MAG: hypothetical protein EI684_11330 [Candidatus Viridilinea halotolerans]|uniref:Uncharacterized protein n=1 Tax=Candidatus Viridilinea halotolerans TaxID=2491704 RepID=A0A426TZB6_9CHLR|nr:MAG: hypothetical protein EI684_11330 [Candidatus Viridilinea halotolerans]